MVRLKNVERLLLQDNLPILEKIFRQLCIDIVFYPNKIVRQRFRNQFGPSRSLQAVWRKVLKLRVVGRMKVSMRHQKHFAAPRSVRQLADIGQKFLGSRNVEVAPRQHEIGLHIHFPKNVLARWHSTLRRFDACNTFRPPLAKLGAAQREWRSYPSLTKPKRTGHPCLRIDLSRNLRYVMLFYGTRAHNTGRALMRTNLDRKSTRLNSSHANI